MAVRIFIGDNEDIEELPEEFPLAANTAEEMLQAADEDEESSASTSARQNSVPTPVCERS